MYTQNWPIFFIFAPSLLQLHLTTPLWVVFLIIITILSIIPIQYHAEDGKCRSCDFFSKTSTQNEPWVYLVEIPCPIRINSRSVRCFDIFHLHIFSTPVLWGRKTHFLSIHWDQKQTRTFPFQQPAVALSWDWRAPYRSSLVTTQPRYQTVMRPLPVTHGHYTSPLPNTHTCLV